MVGVPGIEPGLYPPQGYGLPLSYTPIYFVLANALIHLVHAKTRLPARVLAHCKLGYFLFLMVGLYFPLSFFNLQTIMVDFPQISQVFVIMEAS